MIRWVGGAARVCEFPKFGDDNSGNAQVDCCDQDLPCIHFQSVGVIATRYILCVQGLSFRSLSLIFLAIRSDALKPPTPHIVFNGTKK